MVGSMKINSKKTGIIFESLDLLLQKRQKTLLFTVMIYKFKFIWKVEPMVTFRS